MQTFGILSYAITLTTSLVLIFILKRETFLLAKPSIWFISFFHLIIQWSSSIYYKDVFFRLDQPYKFLVLTQIFPLVLVLLSRLTFRDSSKIIWKRIAIRPKNPKRVAQQLTKLCFLFLAIGAGIVFIYLQYVPFTKTGFYVNFSDADPLMASIAREKSAKLLPHQWLKYLYGFYGKFLANITVSLLVLLIIYRNRKKKYLSSIFLFCILIVVLIGAILPGGRGPGVRILFVGMATYSIYNIRTFKLLRTAIMGLLIILPAVFIQMAKYNRVGSGEFWHAFEELLIRRALFIPMEVGIYWVNYVEDHGFWGLAGIPKLAWIEGVDPVHVPNFLMNFYFNFSETTGYLTASFVFAYYSYFGPIAYPLLLTVILILDFWVIPYKLIKNHLLLPTVVTINCAVLNLLSSDYLTLFLTYGFFTGILFMLFINSFYLKRKRRLVS